VKFAYPWDEAGTELEHESGPDDQQAQFLRDLGEEVKARKFNGVCPVMPIQMAITSFGAWQE